MLPSLVVALVLVGTPPSTSPKAPPEVIKAAEARIAAAEEQIKLVQLMYEHGSATLDQALEARRGWFLAHREAPLPAARILDAAKTYRDRVAASEQFAESKFKMGMASQAELATAKYALAEADYWLEEARWRASIAAGG